MAAPSERLTLAPERRIRKDLIWRQSGWQPHPGQLPIATCRKRNRVIAAGRRFGKSDLGGNDLVDEAINTRLVKTRLEELGKRREFWIVGPSYSDAEKEFRVMWNTLTRMGLGDYFDRPGSYNDPIGGQMHLSMWGGRFQVHGKSAQHPESLVGEGLSGAIFAEAAKLKERIFTKYVRPTLADFGGWVLMTSTPEGKNWFYDMWKRGQDPSRSDWASFRSPSWANPHVYPGGATDKAIEVYRSQMRHAGRGLGQVDVGQLARLLGLDPEIAALVADLTEESFNQEIGALFTEFVGRVFKGFDEETHVTDLPYEPGWSTYAAVDYGFTNPSVWLLLQVDPFGERVHVLDEVYESGLTIEDFAEEIRQRGLCPSGTISFYPDPASPGDTRILEQKLRVKARGGTGGELKFRLDAIRNALRETNTHLPEGDPERRPTLLFDRKCSRTIADMLNYRYPERKGDATNGAENPLKKDDHGPEALGRFFAGHFGTPDKTARRARQRRANIGA